MYLVCTLRMNRNNGPTFTAIRIVGVHVPISVHARVTTAADNKTFADTTSSDKVVDNIGSTFTLATVLRAHRITVTRCTHTHTMTLILSSVSSHPESGFRPKLELESVCLKWHVILLNCTFSLVLQGDLAVPLSRTTRYGQRCFAVSRPTLWNSLPLSVSDPSLTLTQFCAHLKTVLFCRAYETLA